MNSLSFIDFFSILMYCQCRMLLSKGCSCFFSRPCGKEKRAFVRLLPPLFRQHRPPHFVYCVYPRPVVNKKAWRSAHCTTAIPFALAFRPKESCCFSFYRVWNTPEDHFFCQSLAIFFHAKQARMAQGKNLPGRRRVISCTR